MKHRIVHALQKYVLNPPIKLLFAIGVVPPGYALRETIGRKSGKPRRTPVGDARVAIGSGLWQSTAYRQDTSAILHTTRACG
jgi:hypothetical protein